MASSSKERVSKHRARLRAQGLRPVQMWIPDTTSPEFIAEARRQSLAAAEADRRSDEQDFIDSISILGDPDADAE